MKKIILVLIVLGLITWFYIKRTIKNFEKLYYTPDKFRLKISNVQDALMGFVDGFDADVGFYIRNTTNQNFNLDSLYLELYTPEGSLIAKPVENSNKISIPANKDVNIGISYKIDASGLYKMLGNSVKKEVLTIISNYIETGYLGKKIRLKGNAKKGFVNINLDFEVEV